jgi:multidrug efflux pump subunit AcrA (membrane-fusion protein)
MSRRRIFADFASGPLRVGPGLLAVLVAAGCHHAPPQGHAINVKPKVQIVKPETRTITREVGQPGFVYAYEQTAIYPKVTGYLDKWYVDRGDRIAKGQTIADVSVPELVAEYREKQALAAQSEVQIRVAQQMVDVAERYAQVAGAQVQEARANVNKYQASVERWESEVKRLASAADDRAINPQILEESRKQLKSDTAAREAAKATLGASMANEEARKADVEKAKVDVEAARAKAAVDRAGVERLAALVSYTHILAPYDGIIVDRNANTGDYVQPGTGDLSASSGGPQGDNTRGGAIYVVARTDQVRVYVDVPEVEANYVAAGTKAKIKVQGLEGEEIDAAVTRTSWSLQVRSRTLRAEVDLPNPNARLLPGMYAYGTVVIERPKVRALPLGCVVEVGNQNVCFVYENGKIAQTPVRTGVSDGKWVEVVGKKIDGKWTAFTGSEAVVEGDLAELHNGQEVDVAEPPAHK